MLQLRGSPEPVQLGFPTRDLLIGFVAAVTCLLPTVLFPRVVHSTYMLGGAAVLLTAATARPVGIIAAAVTVIGLGVLLDLRDALGSVELLTRAGVFAVMGAAMYAWARSVRQLQQSSAAVIAELANKEAVLRSILDTGPDAMLVIDRWGKVLTFGASAELLFGWTSADVVGRNVSMLMPGPYRDEHDGYIARYLESGERKVIGKSREVTGLRKDGSRFPMVLHVGEVLVGEERHFTGFVHDLTALNDAHLRTEQLRNQLTHVWRMNSLGEIAAVLSHELNQPLTAISNYVRGARTIVNRLELQNEDLLDALEEAGAQAIRAGEIIRRTRSMVSPQERERQRVSLSALVLEIDLMTGLIAREAAVTLDYNLSQGADDVCVDRIQIQQVVGNLVRNGVDAMTGQDRRILEISTSRLEDAWVVKVSDSGPGVPAEMVAQLFEPLTSTKEQGMGLGLSISRTIIDHHGGAIWVERSRLGGAAFCFSLPDHKVA
ncbi:MAG: PAS domain S-box protein [Caulobacter sp.]|nr:PAS domain S-box protein [Caulobacter sp.]